MVDALGRIIALNVIDSTTVKDALEKLKVILNINKKGSYVSILTSMNYARFALLTLKGYGKKVLGPAFEAFESTYEDAAEKVTKVKDEYDVKSLESFVDPDSLRRFIATGVVETEELQKMLPPKFLDGSPQRIEHESNDGSADVKTS